MQSEKPLSLDDVLTQRVEHAVVRALAVHAGTQASPDSFGVSSGERLSYSMTEVAELLGVGRTVVYELARTNELKTFKIGSRRLVTRKALIEFLEHATVGYEP